MRKLVAVIALLAVAGTSNAWADGFKSYRVCGGATFTMCAAVEINVSGSNVTMRVWNLSQNMGATYGQAAGSNGAAVIDGIGFFNLPAGFMVNTGTLSVTGPVRAGDNATSAANAWNLKNFGSVAFTVDFRAAAQGGGAGNGGIASGCVPGSLATGINLYENPCTGTSGSGWVSFNFTSNGVNWDPRTSAISIRARDINGGQGAGGNGATECWTDTSPSGAPSTCTTITPEPVSMTLLATGLAGMGGAGFFRRRKNKNQVS